MSTPEQARFEGLLAPYSASLRAYVHRMVGHRADAEDLVQEVELRAFERLATLRSETAFRAWLFRIATHACLDHLRRQVRWRSDSQVELEQACAEDGALRQRLLDVTRDPEFHFDVREHLSFCFTCVARSLAPEQQAALILRELMGLSNKEAAAVLQLSDSVLRHRLSAARQAMRERYEDLCALVNKRGMCRQCASFRNATASERRGPALPVLESSAGSWATRVEQVRAHPCHEGVSAELHDLMFELLATRVGSQ